MSVMRPISNRERRRSSSVLMALGGRSLEMTICLPLSFSALKVWKNSSCVCSRPSSIWMSSMSRMSVLR